MRFLLLTFLLLTAAATPLRSQDQDKRLQANPADDLFELALLAYQEALDTGDAKLRSANFEAALRQFTRFLQHHGEHANALKAWYYSAICYDKLGQEDASLRCLRTVVEKWKKGPLVGAAAMQVANSLYDAKKFEEASALFLRAAEESDHAPARHLALYRRALCFQKLEQPEKTIAALEKVLASPDTPYRSQAAKALAHYYRNAGEKEKAYTLFRKLAESEDRELRADAILQSALLARDLGREKETIGHFEEILRTPGLEKWRGEAQLYLMSVAARAKDHARVLELFQGKRFPLKKEQEAKRLLLAIQAMEQTGRGQETTALYLELEKIAPDQKTGLEASYIVLSRLYTGDQPREFGRRAREFLKTYAKSHPEDARLDNVRLMLAETEYAAKRYREAARHYEAIRLERLDQENHAGVRFRLASALRHAGDHEGAGRALEEFLRHHPKDPRAPTALAKRGDTALDRGDFAAALRDYERLLTLTEDPKLLEYAWAQKAEVHKKQNDLPALIAAHRHLLTHFPKRNNTARAASLFWTGWAQFRLDDFESCLSSFELARETDPRTFDKEATLYLALTHYTLEHLEDLQREVDHLRDHHPGTRLPTPLYAWLGTKLATAEDHAAAWKYLPRAVTWKTPGETKTVVWLAHAKSAFATKHFKEALRSYGLLLTREKNAFRRADYHYRLAAASFALQDHERARREAEAALELKPQGELNGQIRLLLGDLARAGDDAETALQHYVVVVELFNEDAETKRKALAAAIEILEKKGDPETLEQAQKYRKQLKSL